MFRFFEYFKFFVTGGKKMGLFKKSRMIFFVWKIAWRSKSNKRWDNIGFGCKVMPV